MTPVRTKAEIQIHGILAGLDTKTILDMVEAAHPGSKTSKACVAWYKSHLRMAALPPSDPRHDKRFVKYLEGGTKSVPEARSTSPAGSWVFVPAEDAGNAEYDSWATEPTQE